MIKRVLIIQTAFIGDVILATPAIEKLKKFFPDSRVDFLVRKGNEELLKNNPYINNVLIFNKKKKKYLNLIHLIKYIRSIKYDLLINLQRHSTTGIITVFSKAGTTVGFSENPQSRFFSKSFPHGISTQKASGHEVERVLRLIAEYTDNEMVRPKLFPSESDRLKVIPPDTYFCIAPNSVLKTKEFPQSKWVELIEKLRTKGAVYILGAPNEKEKSQKLYEQVKYNNVFNLTGQLSILESAALMEKAKMNFTNDSAPLHIASAVNAPVRAIFLSTSPILGFTPLSDDSMVIETKKKLACKPCGHTGKKECPLGHFSCSDINIDDIIKTI